MKVVAGAYLIWLGFCFLPGSVFKVKPKISDYKWDGPHVYANFFATAAGVVLSVWALVT